MFTNEVTLLIELAYAGKTLVTEDDVKSTTKIMNSPMFVATAREQGVILSHKPAANPDPHVFGLYLVPKDLMTLRTNDMQRGVSWVMWQRLTSWAKCMTLGSKHNVNDVLLSINVRLTKGARQSWIDFLYHMPKEVRIHTHINLTEDGRAFHII